MAHEAWPLKILSLALVFIFQQNFQFPSTRIQIQISAFHLSYTSRICLTLQRIMFKMYFTSPQVFLFWGTKVQFRSWEPTEFDSTTYLLFFGPLYPQGTVYPIGLLSHSLCFDDNQNNDARTTFFNKVKAESLCQRRIVLQRCLAENGLGLIAEMDFLMGVSLRRTKPLCLCTVCKNIL